MISQEYIPELVILIAKDRKRSHYYFIKLLTILLEEDYDALEELAKAELNVEEILRGLMASSEGVAELRVDVQLFCCCSNCYLIFICFRMKGVHVNDFYTLLLV